jgi:hypothetical protein
MTSISNFESNVYSEEIYSVDEQEFDEVNTMVAQESDWQGYGEWSQELEQVQIVAESENFIAYADGTVKHRPEPKSNGRIGGIEI